MATILESFDIDSPERGQKFTIDLAEGLDASHLDFMETEWQPAIRRQHNLAILQFFQLPEPDRTSEKWLEIRGALEVQDQHWDWGTKSSVAPGTNRRVLSLLNGNEVEAAMVLVTGRTSREPGTPLPILYVDYLAVAPWNRRTFQNPQRFRHLGTVMIGAAVELSLTLGLDGRCGLHSLPQSEGFYRRIGMRDFGLDAAYSSLRYFEFDAAAARNLRNG